MSSDRFEYLEGLSAEGDLGGVLDVMWEMQEDDATLEAMVVRFSDAEDVLLRRALAFILARALFPDRRGLRIRRAVRAYFQPPEGVDGVIVDRTVAFNALTVGHRYALFLARKTDAAWLPEGLRPLLLLASDLGELFVLQAEDVLWALSERCLLDQFFSRAERAGFAEMVSDPLVRMALIERG